MYFKKTKTFIPVKKSKQVIPVFCKSVTGFHRLISKMQQNLKPRIANFTCERLVYGNGPRDRSNVLLNKGIIYASSSIHGGNESFYEMDWDSLHLYKRYIMRVLRDDARWSTNRRKVEWVSR